MTEADHAALRKWNAWHDEQRRREEDKQWQKACDDLESRNRTAAADASWEARWNAHLARMFG